MSTDAWAAYQARQEQARGTSDYVLPPLGRIRWEGGVAYHAPDGVSAAAIPPASDPLATTIRQALDARALGMSVEEHQLPGDG